MRIVAGKFGSRILKPLRDLKLRPTSDRLRETLFNVLSDRVSGSMFVDCYAGTGAVGIEALSRGARSVIFIEKDTAACALIRANLAALGVNVSSLRGENTEVQILATDARRGLAQLAERNTRADLLFVDPPYAEMDRCVSVLEKTVDSRLLAPGATVVIEHGVRDRMPEEIALIKSVRVLKQGDSALSFYRMGGSDSKEGA